MSLACAPVAVPAPIPAPAPQASPAIPAPLAPAVAPEDTAWAKVVEAAKMEKSLTIYSMHFSGDIGQAMAKAFKEQYGIRMEILAAPGRQTVEKIKVEQTLKAPIADIIQTGASSATEVSIAGFLESVWRELPAIRDKGVFKVDPVYSPSGDILTFSIQLIAPYINYNLVKAQEEFSSFYDLLDPKWKGKIITGDPRGGGGNMFAVFTIMRYYKGLDDGYFRRLAQQELIIWGGSPAEEIRVVARGEYPVGFAGGNQTAASIIAEGAPVKFLAMKEGTHSTSQSIGVVKGAPHPNAARLFMNWIFSPEGQTAFAQSSSTSPLRLDVPDFLHPGARIKPIKIWASNWDSTEAGNKDQKSGIIEQIFGKK